jgi:septum formation protein
LRTLERTRTFSCVTEVTFAELTKEQIKHYVDHYAPFDKAGAYGIQEWIGYVGVTSINGSFYNVMGLPVQRLNQELKAFINNETDSFVDNFIY